MYLSLRCDRCSLLAKFTSCIPRWYFSMIPRPRFLTVNSGHIITAVFGIVFVCKWFFWKLAILEFPLWHSGLMMQCCRSCGTGCSGSLGFELLLGNFCILWVWPLKKKSKNYIAVIVYNNLISTTRYPSVFKICLILAFNGLFAAGSWWTRPVCYSWSLSLVSPSPSAPLLCCSPSSLVFVSVSSPAWRYSLLLCLSCELVFRFQALMEVSLGLGAGGARSWLAGPWYFRGEAVVSVAIEGHHQDPLCLEFPLWALWLGG